MDAKTDFDFDERVAHLKCVFGNAIICPVVYVDDEGFEKLCETVIQYVEDVYPDKNKTFKVHLTFAMTQLYISAPCKQKLHQPNYSSH